MTRPNRHKNEQLNTRMSTETRHRLEAIKDTFDTTATDLVDNVIDQLYYFTTPCPSIKTRFWVSRYLETMHPLYLVLAQEEHSITFRDENNAIADYNGYVYHEDLPWDAVDEGETTAVRLRNLTRTYMREVLTPEAVELLANGEDITDSITTWFND
jgi:hypothetical protein